MNYQTIYTKMIPLYTQEPRREKNWTDSNNQITGRKEIISTFWKNFLVKVFVFVNYWIWIPVDDHLFVQLDD